MDIPTQKGSGRFQDKRYDLSNGPPVRSSTLLLSPESIITFDSVLVLVSTCENSFD